MVSMDNLHTRPRLFTETTLKNGASITFDHNQTHYLIHVMRAKEGDTIRLFNGQDGEWIATLNEVPTKKKQCATLTVQEQRLPQDEVPDLWLCAAPIKRAHFDYMIMKATELGVKCIQPVLTERTQIRDLKLNRLRQIAIEAAEQSERLTIPEIKKPLNLPDLITNWPDQRLAILCAEFGEALPIGQAFVNHDIKKHNQVAVFTGPEGGYTQAELNAFLKLNRHLPIRLGSRILRADTAAIAALSCWQSLCGDWNGDNKNEKVPR